MSVLAFIPARAGSKGIPHKNMRLVGGKPLVQYTLEAARDCPEVDSIFISTDDADVVEVAASLGLEVPYNRPATVSGDRTSMFDTVRDGLEWLQAQGGKLPDVIALLQPTSPLRTAHHLQEALVQFLNSAANTLVSVNRMNDHPFECVRGESGDWRYLSEPDGALRRQDYPSEFYYINGAIYLVRTPWLMRNGRFFEDNAALLYEMKAHDSIDIDEELDLLVAEVMLDRYSGQQASRSSS